MTKIPKIPLPPGERIVSRREARRRIGDRSDRTLTYWQERGWLPAQVASGGFLESEFARALANLPRRRGPRAEAKATASAAAERLSA
jgi:hypothetical protein